MPDEAEQYQAEFVGKAQGVAIGTGNVIYNYFYASSTSNPHETEADDGVGLPCPYRGLFHFGPNDAEVFFGRDVFVAELYEAVQTRGLVPVLGASGSGKSSVVLAGLVPKLQAAGHWQFTHFRPGNDPFHSLAVALVPLYAAHRNETEQIAQSRQLASYLRAGKTPLGDVFAKIQQNFPQDRILLIADQFEELYTLCPDTGTRQQFLDLLVSEFQAATTQSGQAVLVLTMRADFLGNALAYPAFADQLRQGDIKIRSMNREELTEVIEKPAAKLGVTFEGGLVERILSDVAEQPGNLPLLEFALTELWQQRRSKELTHEVYRAIGKVEGALARHADQKYDQLSEAEKAQVRRIFVQLVQPGEGAEDTRRIAVKSELGEQSWSLVKQLADARLVVTSRNAIEQETVEVVHEALIRNWGELRGWMETDRVFRAWQERLRGAMRHWEATGRDAGSLLRGAALAEAAERLAERPDDLGAEREFIQRSVQEQDRVEHEKAARRRREVRTTWGIVIGSSVALVISSALFISARYQQQQAELSEADSLARYSLTLLAEQRDLDASVAAIQAGRIIQRHQAHDPEVMSALAANLYDGQESNTWNAHNDVVLIANFSPDGQVLATGSWDYTAKLWSVETGKEIRTLHGHKGSVSWVGFSPNGQIIATASRDDTVKLWNAATGEEIRTLFGHKDGVEWGDFSPNGQSLSTASQDGTVKLWNVAIGAEIRTLAGHEDVVLSVSYSPDGKTLATASEDQTVKLWNVDTGTEIRTLAGHEGGVISVSYSPDGKALATGSGDRTVKLWNVATGAEIRTLTGHEGWVSSVSYSPDGKTLATASQDQKVKLWNPETGEEISTFSGFIDWVNSVSFSPNGHTLATAAGNEPVTLWKTNLKNETLAFSGHEDWILGVSFSPHGTTLASASSDGTVKLWNATTGAEIHTLTGHKGRVWGASYSPDGTTLASASSDQTVKLWEVATGAEIHTLTGHEGWVSSVSYSPDGKTLTTASFDWTVKLWNATTGAEIRTLSGHEEGVKSVSYSPDGKTLATASNDKTVKLWNATTGAEIRTLSGHEGWVNSVSYSPDGKILATASDDKTVKLWSVETGEEILTLFGHEGLVSSVSFSPNGQLLVTGSGDNTAKSWRIDVNLDSLIERNCNYIRNYLTNNSNVSEEERHLCDGFDTEQE